MKKKVDWFARYCADKPKLVALISIVLGGLALVCATVFMVISSRSLNDECLYIISLYTLDGTYRTLPKEMFNDSSGTTRDLYYQGRRVAVGDPEKRAYCVGLMFEVYMRACEKAGGDNFLLSKVSSSNFSQFKKDWYGADGNKRTFVRALTERQLGEEVTDWDEVKAGDFVQFWRESGNGHAVLFLEWSRDESGNRNGIKYWSIQGKTIYINTEYFLPYGVIIPEETYIVRAFEP